MGWVLIMMVVVGFDCCGGGGWLVGFDCCNLDFQWWLWLSFGGRWLCGFSRERERERKEKNNFYFLFFHFLYHSIA